MKKNKSIMRALAGEKLPTPPIWMMRQAGRYLPEYRATRAEAGDFLSLCYNSDLATEVTLQPIRRYGFDASILFADILLLPQALGADLWFVAGEGPRLSTVTDARDLAQLKGKDDIHNQLAPIYQTVKNLSQALPQETTLIGFAGAPWTVATYMIAGKGTPDQAPAHLLKSTDRPVFEALINLLTETTIEYLSQQVQAGAEVIKLFDSWAGSLKGDDFTDFALEPTKRIISALKASTQPLQSSLFREKREKTTLALLRKRVLIVLQSTTPFHQHGLRNTSRKMDVFKATLPHTTWCPEGKR